MPRMTRVSPPELARELPAPQGSRSVTRAPARRSQRAVQPPKAPAPRTATWGLPPELASAGAAAVPVAPEAGGSPPAAAEAASAGRAKEALIMSRRVIGQDP